MAKQRIYFFSIANISFRIALLCFSLGTFDALDVTNKLAPTENIIPVTVYNVDTVLSATSNVGNSTDVNNDTIQLLIIPSITFILESF